nr:hypothetical protein [Rhizobium leguminosarum]
MPLRELVMIEAPSSLEHLIRSQADANGIEIIRGEPVEITCVSAEYPHATFLIYWAHEDAHLHMLVPKGFASGLA